MKKRNLLWILAFPLLVLYVIGVAFAIGCAYIAYLLMCEDKQNICMGRWLASLHDE